MASRDRFTQSLVAGGAQVMCMDPKSIAGLTPEQISALHACKHEILGSLCRLYMTVPQKKADVILKKYLNFSNATK
jgi:hypothetical protein